jgi:catechol 2,3-dioxygenase-like lactoylglutathione lyase family enzyme
MTLNPKGGGVLEFIEFKSCPIGPFPEDRGYGDFGVLEMGFSVKDIEGVVDSFEAKGVVFLTSVCSMQLSDGRTWRYAYLRDPNGMRVQLVEDIRPGQPAARKPEVHGAFHVGIGVSDIRKAAQFYEKVLGFDRQVYAFEGHNPDLDPVTGRAARMSTVILERSAPNTGAIRELPQGTIKLMSVPDRKGTHLYDGRKWGDMGCMEFCMDVSELETTVAEARAKGAPVSLEPCEIDMGSGSRGKVAYIQDPDGTTIEFVEICSVAWLSASTFMRIAVPLIKLYDRLVN